MTPTRWIAVAFLATLVGCSAARPAEAPIAWAEIDHWSVHVVTSDAAGSVRVARIWLVLHEGKGAIRTGQSRWRANIERGSAVALRVDGVDYPVSTSAVDDPRVREAIDAEFLRKYGWQESAFIPSARAASDDAYLLLETAPSLP